MPKKNKPLLKRIASTYGYIQKAAKKHQRSFFGVVKEMLYLYVKNGIGPNYYLLAGMADKNMSWSEKCQHLSDANYHKAIEILNPKPYRKITQHKLTEKSFFTLAKIPTAGFIGFYHPIQGFDEQGNALTTIEQLSALLSLYQEQKICIKLPEGFGGAGFFAGKVDKIIDAGIYIKPINKQQAQVLSVILAGYTDVIKSQGLLFETYIEQSEAYAKFNPTSVNTVRTWVLQQGNNIEVIGALFRIGRENALTDNSSSGGLLLPVDIKTGRLAKGSTTLTPHSEEFSHHLDSGLQLEGEILAHWQQVIDCSCETLRKLPCTHFAGLDVCMTAQGPLIIEVNVEPDKDGAAYAGIPSYVLKQAASAL